jgi:hypothetical protein
MKNKIAIVLIVLLALAVSSAYAGNFKRIGTAGAQELLIPIGSRGSALGGAVIADVSGVESIFWNPAGLATLEGKQAMFTHLPYVADISVNFGGIAANFENIGVLAVSAKVVSIGDIEETTEAAPEGTGSVFNPTLAVMGLSYAKILTANVQFGANVLYINERIADVSATGFAFDAGFIYDPRWKGFSLGLVIKNYGPDMNFSGSGFDRAYEAAGQRKVQGSATAFELPSFMNFGMAYNFLANGPNDATLMGNFRSNNFAEDLWQGGVEYTYDSKYSLRVGYNYSEQEDYVYGVSFGAGLSYPIGETILTFEYSWTETDVFNDNQYFTAKFDF